MGLGSRRTIIGVGTAFACLVGIALSAGQAPQPAQTTPAEKPVMAEDVLKNIQVLRGIPLDEFMGTMGFFAAATSLNCTDCHVSKEKDNNAIMTQLLERPKARAGERRNARKREHQRHEHEGEGRLRFREAREVIDVLDRSVLGAHRHEIRHGALQLSGILDQDDPIFFHPMIFPVTSLTFPLTP